MTHLISRADLARWATLSEEAMLACSYALARQPELAENLAQNPRLPAPVWRQLWGTRPDLDRACRLVERSLARPERDLVLRKEKRSRVLTRLVEHNVLAVDEQDAVVDAATEQVAAKLLEQDWTDQAIRRKVAVGIGGLPLLHEMALGRLSQFSDAEAATLLGTFHEWAPEGAFKERAKLLSILLLRRPALVEVAVHSGEDSLVTSAAGVLGLSDELAREIAGLPAGLTLDQVGSRKFALLALVNNPSVALATVEEVFASLPKSPELTAIAESLPRRRKRPPVVPSAVEADGDELSWLLHRSLPSDYGDGKLADMVRLLANRNLAEEDRSRLHQGLRGRMMAGDELAVALAPFLAVDPELTLLEPGGRYRDDSVPTSVVRFCTAAEAALGADPQKWETLIGLMHEFDGTADDLLVACAHL